MFQLRINVQIWSILLKKYSSWMRVTVGVITILTKFIYSFICLFISSTVRSDFEILDNLIMYLH
jgi:hypothetical protein